MNYRLLIAEDDLLTLQILERSLKHPDVEIVTAPDGLAALQSLHKQSCHLLLTDLYMPGLNGVELTRNLRAAPQFNRLIIGLVTFETDNAILHEAKLAGVDFTIEKPLDLATLSTFVWRRLMGNRAVVS